MEKKQAEEELKRTFDTQRQQAELFYKNVIVQRVKELKELWESFNNQGMFEVHRIAGRSQDESPKASDNADMESEAKTTPGTSDSNEDASLWTKRKIQDTEAEPQIKKLKTGMEEVDGDTVVSVLQQKTKPKTDILMFDPALTKLMDAIKPYLNQGIIFGSDLISKIFVLLPKYVDQNSLLQDTYRRVVSRIRSLMEWCEDWLKYIFQFHESRAKLVSKTVKYPTVKDYRIAVSQCDDKLRIDLHRLLVTFRNMYIEVYDIFDQEYAITAAIK